MTINLTAELIQQAYDGLILVHPHIQVLEKTAGEIQGYGVATLNVSKDLSAALMPVSANERSRFSQKWLVDSLTAFPDGPVLCVHPDLLFDASLEIDPLALFRQAARVRRIVVLWPGDCSGSTLAYAVPEHHHYRTWKLSDALLRQPVLRIQRILDS